ncbi:hypothetical protein MRS44_010630 [Fusarium solani]|uniref:uncharacterized protein n=1 Tax=Fusarium solani TaxID=169388 RepID=UPI0032C3E445|nr:hypothetical protein MRS44_010630 [Fusarium solani]
MASIIGRLVGAFYPTVVAKRDDAIKLGILGAANVAHMSLLTPAKSHPEIVIQAVAARDRKKAEEYAKANGIPEVKGSYQEMLDDKNIDAIYIPLPTSFHYEWAVRCIKAGKHVLIEKPCVSNAHEAEKLFNLPDLSQPNAPVILEAFHTLFYPSWQYFLSFVNPDDIEHIYSQSMLPWYFTSKEGIIFDYNLSGGAMICMGTYNFAAIRQLFRAEPTECLSCETQTFPGEGREKCDIAFKAKFRFPSGAIAETESTVRGSSIWTPSSVTVTNKEVIVPDKSLPSGQEKVLKRELTLYGFLNGIVWHRIDIKDRYTIRSNGKVIKTWEEKESHKAYTFEEAGGRFADLPGEDTWISYRHMLEQFVNKVKGRETQTWVSGEDSIGHMRMIDMAYEKSGLGIRPTRKYE